MRTNLNTIYHKGRFRCREWAKHLRPYAKRVGNKRFRKNVSALIEDELMEDCISWPKKTNKKSIRVYITTVRNGFKYSSIQKFRSLRDAKNSINRSCVIRYKFL